MHTVKLRPFLVGWRHPWLVGVVALLSPVNSLKGAVSAAVVGVSLALTLAVTIDYFLIQPEGPPLPLPTLAGVVALVVALGVAEEYVFRGFPYRMALRLCPRWATPAIVIGTIVWIVLHPFYAAPGAVFDLGSTSIIGIMEIKLWRSRWVWLALAAHPLYNLVYAVARNYIPLF